MGRKFWFVASGVYLVCVAGFRWQLGADTYFYMQWFEHVPKIDSLTLVFFAIQRYEPLFVILASVCKTIYPEFWVLQFVQAAFVTIVVFRFINQETKHIFTGAALYFFILFFGFMYDIMRESIAISFFILSWPYLMRGKWVPYYILIVVACLFHSGAIVFCLLPLLRYKSWKYLRWRSTTPIVFLLITIVGFIVGMAMYKLLAVLPLPTALGARIEAYSMNDEGGAALNLFGMVQVLINKALYPIIIILLYKREKKLKLISDIEPMVLLFLFFTFLQLPIMILRRFGNYFILFTIVLYSRFAFNKVLSATKRWGIASWLFFFSLILGSTILYRARVDPSTGVRKLYLVYPYTHIFNRVDVPERERIFNFLELNRERD